MALGIDKSSNHLLAALPEAEWQRWLPHMELVNLKLGQVLYESGGTMQYVYFPIDAIVSLLFVLENGSSAEIAVVGNEGIVGVSLFMGGETTPSRGSKRRQMREIERLQVEERVQQLAARHALVVALHTSLDHTNDANRGVQPPSLTRPTAVPLALAEHGPLDGQPFGDDARADCLRPSATECLTSHRPPNHWVDAPARCGTPHRLRDRDFATRAMAPRVRTWPPCADRHGCSRV